jgi:hypothetical protein
MSKHLSCAQQFGYWRSLLHSPPFAEIAPAAAGMPRRKIKQNKDWRSFVPAGRIL